MIDWLLPYCTSTYPFVTPPVPAVHLNLKTANPCCGACIITALFHSLPTHSPHRFASFLFPLPVVAATHSRYLTYYITTSLLTSLSHLILFPALETSHPHERSCRLRYPQHLLRPQLYIPVPLLHEPFRQPIRISNGHAAYDLVSFSSTKSDTTLLSSLFGPRSWFFASLGWTL